MKSLFKIPSIFGLIVVTALLFGCTMNEEVCKHPASKKWTVDETYHWHMAACNHEGEISGKAEHVFSDWIQEKAPTVDETGLSIRVCSVCQYSESKTIPQIGHTHEFSSVWYYDDVEHWRPAVCGHENECCDKENHTFGQWTVTRKATELEAGCRERLCSVCNYSQKEIIPVVGHDFSDWKILKEATKTETGSKQRICMACNYVENAEIPVLGHIHTYAVWTFEKTAGVDVEGLKKSVCTGCGEETSEVIPMVHSFDESNYMFDDTYHWYGSTCAHKELKKNSAYHVLYTTNTAIRCRYCGYYKASGSGNQGNQNDDPDGDDSGEGSGEDSNAFVSVRFNFDLTDIKYDAVIKECKSIKNIIRITGTGSREGVSETPKMTFSGSMLTARVSLGVGKYKLSILSYGSEKFVKEFNAVKSDDLQTVDFGKADFTEMDPGRLYISRDGVYRSDCLTFKSEDRFKIEIPNKFYEGKIYYSTDPWGDDFSEYVSGDMEAKKTEDSYYLLVRGKGNGTGLNSKVVVPDASDPDYDYFINRYINFTHFELKADEELSCYGNIMTLLEYDDPGTVVSDYGFTLLCGDWGGRYEPIKLNTAPELPAVKVGKYAYMCMFGSTTVKNSPVLPALELDEGCYAGMFVSDKSLIDAPRLNATVLYPNCYSQMFKYCEKLITNGTNGVKICTFTVDMVKGASDSWSAIRGMLEGTDCPPGFLDSFTGGDFYYEVQE